MHCEPMQRANQKPHPEPADLAGGKNKWDRLPACHFINDRLEAYPTFETRLLLLCNALSSGLNELHRHAADDGLSRRSFMNE